MDSEYQNQLDFKIERPKVIRLIEGIKGTLPDSLKKELLTSEEYFGMFVGDREEVSGKELLTSTEIESNLIVRSIGYRIIAIHLLLECDN